MVRESTAIKEIEYPDCMSWDLAEKWVDGIPEFSENDPMNPEWMATPTFQIDLSALGYGVVSVKDESDIRSNPTGTIKDRPAWECAALFRDYAKLLFSKKREGILNGNVGNLTVPRVTYVSAGNMGRAFAHRLERHGLPPMKILLDKSIPPERLEQLKRLHTDIYLTDLSGSELSAKDINEMTNNRGGIDITSAMIIEPHAVFYDWHVHEAFNERPTEIYMPYGSGRLMENYLTWQARNSRKKDPRLMIPVEELVDISILGVEPEQRISLADKLMKDHNPFVLYGNQDISALERLAFTGNDTGIYHVSEDRIKQAYNILSRYLNVEPSACAGLALYLQRYDEGKIDPGARPLIINTGKGI